MALTTHLAICILMIVDSLISNNQNINQLGKHEDALCSIILNTQCYFNYSYEKQQMHLSHYYANLVISSINDKIIYMPAKALK